MAYQSINPFNGKTLASFDEHGRDELENKLQAAQRCFDDDWRQRSYAERAIVVKRAAALMRQRADELAKLITLEMGKLIAQAAGEVALSAAILDYYADNAEQFLAPEQLDATGNRTMVESSPLGVLLGIEP